jgi:3-deoxy-manno-octulosonate cytidylyltransferase (CMP-KDO synthetase)
MTSFKVVIPARYASTRLPGKPLRDIAGKPMILHVCDKALKAGADEVIVATDDLRIHEAVLAAGVESIMTQAHHHSGTERIAEVAAIKGWSDTEIIVNLQGDEPLIPPALIKQTADVLANQDKAGIATLCSPIDSLDELFNTNAVKVVLDHAGYALYFSRAAIPWDRDGFSKEAKQIRATYYRHVGMYAYTAGFLKRYISWPESDLEQIESLEQLRILWQGESITVSVIDEVPEAGVDTEEDLMRVEACLRKA